MHTQRHKKIDSHRTFFIGATTPIKGKVGAVVLVDGAAAAKHMCVAV